MLHSCILLRDWIEQLCRAGFLLIGFIGHRCDRIGFAISTSGRCSVVRVGTLPAQLQAQLHVQACPTPRTSPTEWQLQVNLLSFELRQSHLHLGLPYEIISWCMKWPVIMHRENELCARALRARVWVVLLLQLQ